MKLDRKLSEVLPQERERFLTLKYRELRLVQQVDRLTDRHNNIPDLIRKALQLIVRLYHCDTAAFLLTSAQAEDDRGFFFLHREGSEDHPLKPVVRSVLEGFLNEPLAERLNNEPAVSVLQRGLSRYLVFPMVISSQLEGAFLVGNREKPFTENDLYFLSVISSQLDNGVVHGRMTEEHRRAKKSLKLRARELEALYEMSLSLSFGYDFETLTKKVLESVTALVNLDRASVMLYDPKTDDLKTTLVVGEKQKIRLVKLSMGKGIAGLALLSRKPILAPMGAEDDRFVPFEFPNIKARKIYSLACLSLLAGEKPLGVMNFCTLSRKKALAEHDLETLSVAAHLVSLALQRQQFYQMSIKDELTDLYTFRYFKERLLEEVTRARRYQMVFSLVLFDLDHFKSVNDTYGHPFGNQVLQAVAGVIHHSVRAGVDMPARFGGEEMALILPHTNEQGAFILAERIRARVEELKLVFEGKPVKITISGGLASFPPHGDTAEKLLQHSDEALYKSKLNGRNRITVAGVNPPG